MNRREAIKYGLAFLAGFIPSSSAEPIRRGRIQLPIPPIVETYARNVEVMRNDTILRAGSVLFYGSDPRRFPAQGSLLKDEGKYYVSTIKHAIAALALREHKMGLYIPFLGNFVEDSRRFSVYLSQSTVNENIVALPMQEAQQQMLRILETAGYVLPLQLRKEVPEVGHMVAIPHPETANYSYHRITNIMQDIITLEEETRYQNPPICSGQSGAPLLFIDESSGEPKLTNEVIGVLSGSVITTKQYVDEFNRLCSSAAIVAQLHNRFSRKP